MNLLYYQSTENGVGEKLRDVIGRHVPDDKVELHRTLDSLSQRFRRPTHDLRLAVLLAAEPGDLLDIVAMRDLLQSIRTILILPDREPDTISKAHCLYPRYLGYTDGSFEDVGAVIGKIMSTAERF